MESNWKTEFPDFLDMPELPRGLRDSSWHNDACPSFIVWQDETVPKYETFKLWVDWANPDLREIPTAKRFTLCAMSEDGRFESISLIEESDSWEDIRPAVEFLRDNGGDVERLSRYFSALIRAEYTESELQEVIRKNRAAGYHESSCATHDYRDSNAYMYGAFCALFFREAESDSEHDAALINFAWKLSQRSDFAE